MTNPAPLSDQQKALEQAIRDNGILRAIIDSLRTQLATARDEVLEEAAEIAVDKAVGAPLVGYATARKACCDVAAAIRARRTQKS